MADYFEIDFLDVETKKSGDAIAIRYEKNGRTFIHVVDGRYSDTGEKLRDHILKYYNNPNRIDHVVATHNDGDHARGLVPVLEHFEVGVLWMLRPWMYAAELLPRFRNYTNVDNLRAALRTAYSNLADLETIAINRRIPIYEPFQGGLVGQFRVMAPTRSRFLDLVASSEKTPAVADAAIGGMVSSFYEAFRSAVSYVAAAWGAEAFPPEDTSNKNEMSVVQFAELCGERILLTADTGRYGLAEMINYAPRIGLRLPGIGRFQVPHHGGRHNVSTELLVLLCHKLALWQQGHRGSRRAILRANLMRMLVMDDLTWRSVRIGGSAASKTVG